MKPFAFLVARPNSPIGDDEYRSFLALSQLPAHMLERVRMDSIDFAEFEPSRYAGFIVGGSPFDLTLAKEEKSAQQLRIESFLESLNELVFANDLPFLGICFGLEAMALYQNEQLVNSYREEISAPRISLTPAGQRDPVFSQLQDLGKEFQCYTGHAEALDPNTKRDAVVLASSETCPVQAVRWKENIYGVQFHPEIDWQGIELRVSLYSGKYYAAGDGERILHAAKRADVRAGGEILKAFVRAYSC
ncbi:GMP synthase (glutamine-hydrolyzing) [Arcanobacterium pluranimalium]|uniref:glutamine amidotransferase-related protein n=1 Tax=Arcanobacterium pluranimalium TaxID=108028 RepID=UPI001958FAB4|nr:gamma-glutamyl-gamma-aminobutyrate hydrolase family protein [Arcanobacterium pluranimalium]MBM7825361.1 GMP synthase (glutamine-hydrolyzing) [Arcanobacterium pluranimalium]